MQPIVSIKQCLIATIDDGDPGRRLKAGLDFLTEVSTKIACPILHYSSKWYGRDEMIGYMHELKRSRSPQNGGCLLLAGNHLEQQITVLALEALAEGFDVHLLNDLISAHDKHRSATLQLRLIQAGAVPTTLRQLLYLWRYSEADSDVIMMLQDLLEAYDGLGIGRLR